MRRWTHLPSSVFLLAVMAILWGCTPAWKPPETFDRPPFLARSETATRDGVTVTVGVPSAEETERIFGTALYRDRIQPVWVEVDNQSDVPWMMMKTGIDPARFSPLEAAYQRHSGSKETRSEMDRFFYDMSFRNPIAPGEVDSGYVFTNLDEGYKAVNIDLVTTVRQLNFSFVIRVPGLVTDIDQVDLDAIWPQRFEMDDDPELVEALESLPATTLNKKGDDQGDPLNIVLVGHRQHIFSALIRRGWHQTEITHGASAWKTVKSFLFGSRYRYSPISPLYVYGRHQDIGLQKARSSIHLRNHMRLWLTPYRYRGMDVVLGQISRDIGVKLNWPTITTHAIDPAVDKTREGLVEDLAYSQSLSAVGYVAGSQVSTFEDTHYNLTPDPYYSDGLRAVLFFSERPVSLDEIRILDWKEPGLLRTYRDAKE